MNPQGIDSIAWMQQLAGRMDQLRGRAEIESALEHHELIKVKLRADREQRVRWSEEILAASGAEVVHSIGQVVSLYRRNPKKTVIELPA